MKKTTFGAIVLTLCWLAGVGLLIAFNWQSFKGMEPNAWGDFLAGSVASPLALIWLVASYMQQGDDLKLNTKALLLQQKELQEQVKATKELASHAERQAEVTSAMHDFSLDQSKRMVEERNAERLRNIRPTFIVKMGQRSPLQWNLSLHNIGADAFRVNIVSAHFDKVETSADTSRFPADSAMGLNMYHQTWSSNEIFIEIDCADIDDNNHKFRFKFDEPNNRIVTFEPGQI